MGLIKQLNQEYQSKFISIREAFEAIKEVFPTSTEAEIAKLLIRAENDSLPHKAMLNGLTNEIISIEPSSDESLEYKDLLGKIIRMNLSLDDLENLDSSYFTFEVYPMEDPLWFDTRDLDNLGWHREGFNEALKKNGLDIEAIQQQKSKEPPAWFNPTHLMPYLSLDAAAFTIAICENIINYRELSRDDVENGYMGDIGEHAYKRLLKQAVEQGDISLSPNQEGHTYYDYDWQLNVMDIRRYCHEIGLKWPIPWEEEPEQQDGNQTAVNDPELNARLEELKAANEALKAENEVLKQETKQHKAESKELEKLKQEIAEKSKDACTNGLKFQHQTQYLKLVQLTQERYYHRERFDPYDIETLPNKKVVIGWLTEVHNISGAFAEAVERVACPVSREKTKQKA